MQSCWRAAPRWQQQHHTSLTTCDRDRFHDRVTFDLLTSDQCMPWSITSTDVGVDRSSRFPFRARTRRQTDTHIYGRNWLPIPTARLPTAWVTNWHMLSPVRRAKKDGISNDPSPGYVYKNNDMQPFKILNKAILDRLADFALVHNQTIGAYYLVSMLSKLLLKSTQYMCDLWPSDLLCYPNVGNSRSACCRGPKSKGTKTRFRAVPVIEAARVWLARCDFLLVF